MQIYFSFNLEKETLFSQFMASVIQYWPNMVYEKKDNQMTFFATPRTQNQAHKEIQEFGRYADYTWSEIFQITYYSRNFGICYTPMGCTKIISTFLEMISFLSYPQDQKLYSDFLKYQKDSQERGFILNQEIKDLKETVQKICWDVATLQSDINTLNKKLII